MVNCVCTVLSLKFEIISDGGNVFYSRLRRLDQNGGEDLVVLRTGGVLLLGRRRMAMGRTDGTIKQVVYIPQWPPRLAGSLFANKYHLCFDIGSKGNCTITPPSFQKVDTFHV